MHSSNLDQSWTDWQILSVLLEQGSMSKAAKQLGLTQPTISRRISRLEQDLGQALVERSVTGIIATSTAAKLRPAFQQMQSASEDIQRLLQQDQSQLNGRVTVACSDTLTLALLPAMQELLTDAPGIELEFVSSVDFSNLARGDADLAIRSKPPNKGLFTSCQLGQSPYGVYGSAEYLKRQSMAYSKKNRTEFDWIGLDRKKARLKTAKWLAKNNIEPRFRFSSVHFVIRACQRGMGLALLPEILAPELDLIPLETQLSDCAYQSWLVCHRDRRNIPRVAFIFDQIRKQLTK